jgi:hypothetical protein
METVESECTACDGTGLYRGMCEPDGVAVVCLACDGTGCAIIKYRPFTKRKGRRGVKTVRQSGGRIIAAGAGPAGGSVTYEEFRKGKMPK